MRLGLVVSILIGFLLTSLDADIGYAQQTADQDVNAEALTQKWIEFMTPGAEHELLMQRVGKWTVKMEMRTTPDEVLTESDGTAEMKLIMDGRYLTGTANSNFDGQAFEGYSITGYDKLKNRFVSVWIDNFGTGFTISSGAYDKATKTFTYATMSPDVALGEYKRTKTLERVVSPDEWIQEIYDTTADGKEFLVMKAAYKRDKS